MMIFRFFDWIFPIDEQCFFCFEKVPSFGEIGFGGRCTNLRCNGFFHPKCINKFCQLNPNKPLKCCLCQNGSMVRIGVNGIYPSIRVEIAMQFIIFSWIRLYRSLKQWRFGKAIYTVYSMWIYSLYTLTIRKTIPDNILETMFDEYFTELD